MRQARISVEMLEQSIRFSTLAGKQVAASIHDEQVETIDLGYLRKYHSVCHG